MLDARFAVTRRVFVRRGFLCEWRGRGREREKGRARPCVNEEGEVGVSNPVPV